MYASNCLQDLANLFTVIGVVLALPGFIIAYCEYRKNQTLRRAEFYTKLFEMLFKETTYTEVREFLDEELNETYDQNFEARLKASNNKLLIDLTNYLNFLEYVMVLQKIKAISHNDVMDLLAYYLKRLAENKGAMKFITDYGFKNLEKKINELNAQ